MPSITYRSCVEIAKRFGVNIERTGSRIELWLDSSEITVCNSVSEAWKELHEQFDPRNKVKEQLSKEKLEQAVDLVVNAKIAEMHEKNKTLVKQHLWLLDNIDGLLTFTKHERTSCSDDNPINGSDNPNHVRCTRCQLLRIKKDEFNVGWTFSLNMRYQELEEVPTVDQVKEKLQKL